MTTAPTTPRLRTDLWVWPTMTRLAECLCTELTGAGLPPTCFCGVLPGELVATDYVSEDEGMAWVRLAGGWPYTVFPSTDVTGSPCDMPLAFRLEVGALWCAPVFSDSRGAPPTLADQFEAAEVQVAAMAAMHRAIVCCLPGGRAQVALGTYSPAGPEGGVVGGVWEVVVDGGLTRG